MYDELREAVFVPTPDFIRSDDSGVNYSEVETSPPPLIEIPAQGERDLQLRAIDPKRKLKKGEALYITNTISHHKEASGEHSIEHRLGGFERETFSGRVYLKTRSGDAGVRFKRFAWTQ